MEFIGGEFECVEGGGAGGVEGEGSAAEAEGFGEDTGGESGDEAVERIGGSGGCGVLAEDFLVEERGEEFVGEGGGFVGGECDVTDDDADFLEIDGGGFGVAPSGASCAE